MEANEGRNIIQNTYNLNQREMLTNLQTAINTWRERVPNKCESIQIWKEVLENRNVIQTQIANIIGSATNIA